MFVRVIASSAAVMLFAVSAAAQNLAQSPCPAGTEILPGIPDQNRAAQDACTQAYDIFQFMAPQLGIALAGGNAILGQGSAHGGLGHFSVGLRVNALSGLLPDVANFEPRTSGAQRQTLPTTTHFIGLPTADASVGVFGGIPLGFTSVGAVDVLVSAAYIPTIKATNLSVTPKSNLQLGFGGRLGLLQESLITPGVSVTYLIRNLPETEMVGTAGNGSLTVSRAKVETSAWRLVASKSLVLFSLAAGVGQDRYSLGADISATVSEGGVSGSATVPNTSQSLTRTNYFVDASMNLLVLKLVAELGRVTGGTVDTFNSFSGGAADRGLTYFSLGARFGW